MEDEAMDVELFTTALEDQVRVQTGRIDAGFALVLTYCEVNSVEAYPSGLSNKYEGMVSLGVGDTLCG